MSAVVIVTRVGGAGGARAAAAALACAGSEADRAGLLVDLGGARRPRPSLIASAGARELEERLGAHLPDADVASRGRICHLSLPADAAGLELIGGVLAIVRGSTTAIHVTPRLLQAALDGPLRPTGALLRADLAEDRALTALAVGDLIEREVRPAVLKRPLGRLTARLALAGALARGPGEAFPQPSCVRLLAA